MYTVTRQIGLDAGHRVPFHDSQCRNLHGHRYKVEAKASAPRTVRYGPRGTRGSSSGMVVDFGDLKQVMMEEIHDPYDHSLILWDDDPLLGPGGLYDWLLDDTPPGPKGRSGLIDADALVTVPVIPTAEELARFWFGQIDTGLEILDPEQAEGLQLEELTVWETPNNRATYNRQ